MDLIYHRHKRFPHAHFKCSLSIAGSTEPILTKTANIGISGTRVMLESEIMRSTPIDLEIFIGGRSMKIKGYVVWVTKRVDSGDNKTIFYDTGIQFVNLPREDKDYLAETIEKLNRETNSSQELS